MMGPQPLPKRNLPQPIPPKCPQRPSLAGQTALVTGGTSGIGRGIVEDLLRAGADVMINYISSDEKAENVRRELHDLGGRPTLHRADVSDEAAVEEMFAHAASEFGALDIVVANAGLQRDADLVDMSLDDWRKVIDVNLTGQFLCARAAVRQFLKQGVREDVSCAAGKLIFMSSVHDVIPWAGHANYAASKGGSDMLMKSIAQEVAGQRIRANSVCPGAIRTPINKDAWETEEAYEQLMTLIPSNRIGEVADIGRAVVWLASDESDYIQGARLVIDGGMTLYPGFAAGG